MKLIDRYIYAVTSYLPEEAREDVGKELKSNIEEMLPDNPSEDEVYKVLVELGNPWELASEYNTKKRYLIGPSYYDSYIYVLKMVVGICIAVFLSLEAISWIIEPQTSGYLYSDIGNMIGALISAIFEGTLQGAAWVTIIFVILERSGVATGGLPFAKKEWTPDELPEAPVNNSRKISRVETGFSMFLTILFTVLIILKPQLIAIYLHGDNGSLDITSLLNIERLQLYIPMILILTIIYVAHLIWKFVAGSWNLPLAIFSAIINGAQCVLIIGMLNDKSIFNMEFFATISRILGISYENVLMWLERSIWIAIVAIVAIYIWETISPFLKFKKII
ncbi:MAG TPA: hypothetical protein GXZ21_05945 [Clostridiales bacterium]|nr:hypothetical protein [Clostridiales bacterium]